MPRTRTASLSGALRGSHCGSSSPSPGRFRKMAETATIEAKEDELFAQGVEAAVVEVDGGDDVRRLAFRDGDGVQDLRRKRHDSRRSSASAARRRWRRPQRRLRRVRRGRLALSFAAPGSGEAWPAAAPWFGSPSAAPPVCSASAAARFCSSRLALTSVRTIISGSATAPTTICESATSGAWKTKKPATARGRRSSPRWPGEGLSRPHHLHGAGSHHQEKSTCRRRTS